MAKTTRTASQALILASTLFAASFAEAASRYNPKGPEFRNFRLSRSGQKLDVDVDWLQNGKLTVGFLGQLNELLAPLVPAAYNRDRAEIMAEARIQMNWRLTQQIQPFLNNFRPTEQTRIKKSLAVALDSGDINTDQLTEEMNNPDFIEAAKIIVRNPNSTNETDLQTVRTFVETAGLEPSADEKLKRQDAGLAPVDWDKFDRDAKHQKRAVGRLIERAQKMPVPEKSPAYGRRMQFGF